MRDKIIVTDQLMADRADSEITGLRKQIKNLRNGETFKCWNCDEQHPVEDKMDWGFSEVCTKCFDYLFMEDEIREKRRF